MNPIKIFLSSKVNPAFAGLDKADYTLEHLRQFIKKEFESIEFLGESAFRVIMNETSFESDFTRDAFDACLDKVSESNVVVFLYTGDAGWAPVGDTLANGICHEEYLRAVNDHPSMSFGITLTKFFNGTKYTSDETIRNERFREDIESMYRFHEYETATTVDRLQKDVLNLIKGYVRASLEHAFKAKKESDAANAVFGKTLEWSKLSYTERISEMLKIGQPGFSNVLKNVEVIWHAVPDNLSVTDARNKLGRPFLSEHVEITKSSKEMGIVHFVAVYGNATELQVKNLIGFTDITAIKTPFGYYLWEKTSQIQMFFFTKCVNSMVLGTRKQQLVNWLRSSQELKNVLNRAKGRFHVLSAINESTAIAEGK